MCNRQCWNNLTIGKLYKLKKHKTIPHNAVFVPALLQIFIPKHWVLAVQRGSAKLDSCFSNMAHWPDRITVMKLLMD